jgi:nitrate reductase gamma subunit
MLTGLLISIALFIFFAGNAIRLMKTLRMPAHLRWELYPIPKGPRGRQRYGGSYFEESDWWTKPVETSHRSEVAFVVKEVLLLRGVWENFRALWLWSWLLHWGLYLYVIATLLGMVEGSLPADGNSGTLHGAVVYGYRTGCFLGLVGAAGLVLMRGLNPRLRVFTTRIRIFDLVLLGSIFATGMMSLNAGATGLVNMVRDSLGFPAFLGDSPVVWHVHLILVALFLAYYPFTHMTHAYMKYFTWHDVRWDDPPSSRNPRAEKALASNLQRKSSWAAPHIASGNTATWSEVVKDPNRMGTAGTGDRKVMQTD